MPQYWFRTSDVMAMKIHFMSVCPATTPFVLFIIIIIIIGTLYATGTNIFTFTLLSVY